MRYMLDTNICIYLIKHKPPQVFEKLQEHNPDEICISAVTYAELVHGVEKSKAVERNRLALTILLSNIEILDFDMKAAEEYGVTQRRFCDIFKQNFNTTPNQYIISYKIDLAKKLLECKELSVLDVAYLCGFEDIYYFCKTFKKVTGQTASNFRKQI